MSLGESWGAGELDVHCQVLFLDPSVGLKVPELRLAWPVGAASLPLQFTIDRLHLAGNQVPYSPSTHHTREALQTCKEILGAGLRSLFQLISCQVFLALKKGESRLDFRIYFTLYIFLGLSNI